MPISLLRPDFLREYNCRTAKAEQTNAMAHLNPQQRLSLQRSERGMRAALAVSFIIFLLFALFGARAREAWFSYFYVTLILAALALDAALRRRLKCPSCGHSIGLRTLFGSSHDCSHCD